MVQLSTRLLALTQLLGVVALTHASVDFMAELRSRQINPGQVAPAYDYIVVGGGQSGLVIANRLSEDSGSKSALLPIIVLSNISCLESVLVVEYGYFDDNPAQVEPSSATQYKTSNLFNQTSVALPAIGNKTPSVYAASVVGGGSTVNGMLFDRGSAEDYDAWERFGNTGWNFATLLPYFKKVRNLFSYQATVHP